MLEQRIQQQFFESADLQYQAAEPLSRPIEAALQSLMTSITAGGKVLAGGAGLGATVARHLCSLLVGRLERERPGLAAVALQDDAGLEAAAGASAALARQVRALAHPGDLLFVVENPGSEATRAAVAAAHEKDAHVIVLTTAGATGWAGQLSETDVLVPVPHERPARVAELQMLVVHCLCDALDLQLLGELDP